MTGNWTRVKGGGNGKKINGFERYLGDKWTTLGD